MANIKVTIDYSISDGTKLKFRTPCESTEVEGLVVTYPIKNGVGYAVKTFTFVDAHGTALSGVGNVFTSDVMIEVMLDVTKGRAFIKNADTNSYIEDIKVTVKRMDEERQVIFAEAGKSVKECNDATKKADEVANALNLTAEEIRSGGFVEALKETNNGDKFTIWIGKKEEYEAEKDTIPSHTFCIITDDTTEEDIAAAIEEIKTAVNNITANSLKAYTYGTDREQIPQNANLNEYLDIGAFKCGESSWAKTLTNCPTKEGFIMDVLSSNGNHATANEPYGYVVQRIMTYKGVTYEREITSDATVNIVFGEWQRIVKSAEIEEMQSAYFDKSSSKYAWVANGLSPRDPFECDYFVGVLPYGTPVIFEDVTKDEDAVEVTATAKMGLKYYSLKIYALADGSGSMFEDYDAGFTAVYGYEGAVG